MVCTHVRPDGDCVGSTTGIYNYIKDNYPTIQADLFLEEFPDSYKILRGASDAHSAWTAECNSGKPYDLAFLMDTPSFERAGANGADCIKTGVLPTKEIIEGVADLLANYRDVPILIDPVIVNFAGEQLVSNEAIDAYKEKLFPLATLITPNFREAEFLLGFPPQQDIEKALYTLSNWGCSVIIKSICEGKYLVDYLYDKQNQQITPFPKKKLELTDRNGTGDTLASSIATHLAKGTDLQTAVSRAEAYMHYFLSGPRYYISSAIQQKNKEE